MNIQRILALATSLQIVKLHRRNGPSSLLHFPLSLDMTICTGFQSGLVRSRGQLRPLGPILRQRGVSCSGAVSHHGITEPPQPTKTLETFNSRFAALAPEFKKAVDTYVEENKILVFIKGSKVCAPSLKFNEQQCINEVRHGKPASAV